MLVRTLHELEHTIVMPNLRLVTDYVDKLPLANTPEVFGLHPNAEIGYYTEAVKGMLNHLIELQPQTGMNTNVIIELC